MTNCALCSKKTPEFGKRKLSDGNLLCFSCILKATKIDSNVTSNLKNYSLEDIKKMIESNPKKKTTPDFSLKSCLSAILVLGIMVILIRACFFGGDDNANDSSNRFSFGEGEAYVQAINCIKKELIAPSKAEFYMWDTNMWEINDSTYMVKGPVDVQNEYGAMIRANFECKVIKRRNDTFECRQITIY